MLGLGLALSIAKKTLGDAIDGLLSTLKGRATYYENGSASKSTIKAIDNADVLDKATILLTPTAYSDARVHSVKTYTGDELVTDGSFENGLSDWDSNSNVSIVDGAARFNNIGLSGANAYLIKNSILEAGKTYKFECDVISTNGKGLVLEQSSPGNASIGTTTIGHKIIYFTQGTETYLTIKRVDSETDVTIDNISVTEADADFDFDRASSATRINSSGLVQDMQSITDPELVLNGDFEELGDELVTNGTFDTDSGWTKGTGWSIANGKASCDGNQASDTLIYENIGDQSNETIKFSFTVSDYVSGTLKTAVFGASGTTVHSITSNGDYTFYIDVASGHNGNTGFKAEVGFQGSIDNVSVQQVDPNDRWNLGTGVTIEEDKLKIDGGALQGAEQNNVITSGLSCKVTFTVSDYVSGTVNLRHPLNKEVTANGTYTFYGEANSTKVLIRGSAVSNEFNITNISVKDITFSTEVDLARINYDSNGDNGHILLEPTSTNFVPYSEDFSQSDWVKQTNITPTYNTTETLSPDGTYNATKLVGNGTDGIFDGSLNITGDVTRSVYLKSVSGTINVKLKDSNVDIGTETLTVTTEWQRFYLSGDNGTSTQGIWIDDIPLSGVYIFGAQVENLPYATSYIPTYGSTVTRAAETLTGSGNSTLINSTEGVLYAEIAKAQDDNDNFIVMSLNNDASNSDANSVTIGFDNGQDFYFRVKSPSGTYINATVSSNKNQFYKVALKYKSGDIAVWIDGVEVLTSTDTYTFAVDLDNLSFDLNGNGTLPFYGKCKALAVFNEALSDTELTNLTS